MIELLILYSLVIFLFNFTEFFNVKLIILAIASFLYSNHFCFLFDFLMFKTRLSVRKSFSLIEILILYPLATFSFNSIEFFNVRLTIFIIGSLLNSIDFFCLFPPFFSCVQKSIIRLKIIQSDRTFNSVYTRDVFI